MSDIWEDDDIEVDNESDLVKQLRKIIKDGKKQNQEYLEELNKLRPQVRVNSLTGILNDLKVNPKVAKLIPSDLEVSEESIKGWLDEFGDVFGIAAPQESPAAQDSDGAPAAPANVEPDVAAQWQRIQSQESQSGVTTPDKEAQDIAMLTAAAQAANGDSDAFFAMLKGELPIPS
jgi:hypothetical protein